MCRQSHSCQLGCSGCTDTFDNLCGCTEKGKEGRRHLNVVLKLHHLSHKVKYTYSVDHTGGSDVPGRDGAQDRNGRDTGYAHGVYSSFCWQTVIAIPIPACSGDVTSSRAVHAGYIDFMELLGILASSQLLPSHPDRRTNLQNGKNHGIDDTLMSITIFVFWKILFVQIFHGIHK